MDVFSSLFSLVMIIVVTVVGGLLGYQLGNAVNMEIDGIALPMRYLFGFLGAFIGYRLSVLIFKSSASDDSS